MFQVVNTYKNNCEVEGGWYCKAESALKAFVDNGHNYHIMETTFRSVNSLTLTIYKPFLTYAYVKEVNCQPNVQMVDFTTCDLEEVEKQLEMYKYNKGFNPSIENIYYSKVIIIDLKTGNIVRELNQ